MRGHPVQPQIVAQPGSHLMRSSKVSHCLPSPFKPSPPHRAHVLVQPVHVASLPRCHQTEIPSLPSTTSPQKSKLIRHSRKICSKSQKVVDHHRISNHEKHTRRPIVQMLNKTADKPTSTIPRKVPESNQQPSVYTFAEAC